MASLNLSNLDTQVLINKNLEVGYKAMAADKEYEAEAKEWIEGMVELIVIESEEENWKF